MAGVCICSESWRRAHRGEAESTLPMLLQAASYRLRFSQIAPDFILNNGGLSIAFIFVADVSSELTPAMSLRIEKMRENFQSSYVVTTLATESDYRTFQEFVFRLENRAQKPSFLPVSSVTSGLEKMIRMGHVHAECKRQKIVEKVDLERTQFVQSEDALLASLSAIPGLTTEQAQALQACLGSIEALSRQTGGSIEHNTGLPTDIADGIFKLFNDKKYGSLPVLS